MRLVYLDRDGKRITVEQWRKLLRDPDYGLIARSERRNGCYVETSWIGVVEERESPPCPVIVMARPTDNSPRRDLPPPVFCPLGQTTKAHEAMLAAAGWK
jgi:hypothetical protein